MWCNKYITVPFKDKGRDRSGCDCWGLVRLIYKEMLGLDVPSFLDYNHSNDVKNIPSLIDKNAEKWFKVQKGEEKPFDVALFKSMGKPMHVALVVGDSNMIHCERHKGTHVNNYSSDQEWRRNLLGFYRHAERTNSSFTV